MSEKRLRTAEDARRDPRPGDRVSKGNRRREVMRRNGGEIMYRDWERGAYGSCWITTWQDWTRNAEVLHVAQEGGSHE